MCFYLWGSVLNTFNDLFYVVLSSEATSVWPTAVVLDKSLKKGICQIFATGTYPPLGHRYAGIVWNIYESSQKNYYKSK